MKHKRILSTILCLVLVLGLLAGQADGLNIMGLVRVSSGSWVNVRTGPGTGYDIIYKAQTGDVYECVGTAPNGWYEILLDDGRHGYISGSLVTFTPAAQGQQGGLRLPVYYKDVYGNLLNTGYSYLMPGSTLLRPAAGMVPQGYQLLGPLEVTVSVTQALQATPAAVTFLYTRGQAQQPQQPTPAPQVTATLPVYYLSVFGSYLYTDYISLPLGDNTVYPKQGLVGDHYMLVGSASAQVRVNAQGQPTPASVSFSYQPRPAATVAPVVSVFIPIIYQDHLGNVFYQGSAQVSSGAQNVISASDDLAPAGYVLSSARTLNISVNSQGVASPAQALFVYRDPATITGPQLLPDFVKTRPNAGSYPVYMGPGTHYYRLGNATMSGGVIRVYGQENGWALVGHGLSNGAYRIGYVEMAAIPASVQPPQLTLSAEAKASHSSLFFVNDPIVTKNREIIKRFPVGTQFRLLGYLSHFWAFIEMDNFDGSGKPARGFVPRNDFE